MTGRLAAVNLGWLTMEKFILMAVGVEPEGMGVSPDGKWIAFVSSRKSGDDDKTTGGQIWVLGRQGGEARRLTTRKGGAGDFRWSPDSRQIAFLSLDESKVPVYSLSGDHAQPRKVPR